MFMSADFAAAIVAESTPVRVDSSIFGERECFRRRKGSPPAL